MKKDVGWDVEHPDVRVRLWVEGHVAVLGVAACRLLYRGDKLGLVFGRWTTSKPGFDRAQD
jgi:hypothetical protein